MKWNKIVGQENIKIFFKKAIKEKRVGSGYCFFGIEGVGKFATALGIISTLSCLKPREINGFLEPCEECYNCKSIENLKFPNIEYIFSLPAGKSADKEEDGPIASLSDSLIEDINLKLRQKIANPYAKFKVEGASQIKIAQIRELRKSLSLSNPLPGRKFVVIFNAEEMNIDAQNAFLKTLEEPRDDITFFLLTTRREGLLPTILSRCQSVFFPPLSTEEIFYSLSKEYSMSAEELGIISRFSNGSLTRAYEFVESNLKMMRDKMVDFLRLALRKELPGATLFEQITMFAEKFDKREAQMCLQLLASWIRDVLVFMKSCDSGLLVNFDDNATLVRFANKFGPKPLKEVIEIIENSIYMINSNVQIPTVYLNLFLEIRKVLL